MRWIGLVVALAGCVTYSPHDPEGRGSSGPDAPTGSDGLSPDGNGARPGNPAAREAYTRDVWPIQRDVCGLWCHGAIDEPDFIDIIDADQTYANMQALPSLLGDYSDDAPVAVHSHLPGTDAKAFSSTQLAVVRNWLRLERGE